MQTIKMLHVSLILCVTVQAQFEKDTLTTAEGDLVITFIGHGTLMFEYNDLVIHVDPWTRIADYDRLPSADLVLVTHHHADHADKAALDKVLSDQSVPGRATVMGSSWKMAKPLKNSD